MTIKGMLLTVAGFGGGFNRVDRSSWAAFFCDSRRRFIGYFRVARWAIMMLVKWKKSNLLLQILRTLTNCE